MKVFKNILKYDLKKNNKLFLFLLLFSFFLALILNIAFLRIQINQVSMNMESTVITKINGISYSDFITANWLFNLINWILLTIFIGIVLIFIYKSIGKKNEKEIIVFFQIPANRMIYILCKIIICFFIAIIQIIFYQLINIISYYYFFYEINRGQSIWKYTVLYNNSIFSEIQKINEKSFFFNLNPKILVHNLFVIMPCFILFIILIYILIRMYKSKLILLFLGITTFISFVFLENKIYLKNDIFNFFGKVLLENTLKNNLYGIGIALFLFCIIYYIINKKLEF